jgi:hypothetical protein
VRESAWLQTAATVRDSFADGCGKQGAEENIAAGGPAHLAVATTSSPYVHQRLEKLDFTGARERLRARPGPAARGASASVHPSGDGTLHAF